MPKEIFLTSYDLVPLARSGKKNPTKNSQSKNRVVVSSIIELCNLFESICICLKNHAIMPLAFCELEYCKQQWLTTHSLTFQTVCRFDLFYLSCG